MAIYAQFFMPSTGYIEGTIPPQFSKAAVRSILACGDRGMLRLSGARMPLNCATLMVVREECRRRGFVGFSIISGDSLLKAKTVRAYEPVTAAPTGWAAVRAALNAIPNTDAQTCGDFWDCKCDTDYIHSYDEPMCLVCCHTRSGQPESRLRDVIDHLLSEENL